MQTYLVFTEMHSLFSRNEQSQLLQNVVLCIRKPAVHSAAKTT